MFTKAAIGSCFDPVDPLCVFISYFFKIHFTVSLQSTPRNTSHTCLILHKLLILTELSEKYK
jgi:hypothetical protein